MSEARDSPVNPAHRQPPAAADASQVGADPALRALHGPLVRLCRDAAAAILAVYERGYDVHTKADRSPVTSADLAAHDVLCAGLQRLTPKLPILSEESAAIPWAIRRTWRRFWLVDPLDGTKEFMKRNGEFSVNVALVQDGVPILGVVQEPVADVWHLGHLGLGVWRGEGSAHLTARPLDSLPLRRPVGRLKVAVSRSHRTARLQPLLDAWPITEQVKLGSSLKYCRMVDGELDAYPRLGPTSGWDTAAAHAVLVAAGGEIVDERGAPLRYNDRDSVLNPCFLAVADRSQLAALVPAFRAAAATAWPRSGVDGDKG